MISLLLLVLACSLPTDNGNAERRGRPTVRDTAPADSGDTGASDTGAGDTDTGGPDSADTGAEESLATRYEGSLSFAFTHPSYGDFACTDGATFAVDVVGDSFVGAGSCEGPSLGVWTFTLEGAVDAGALALGTLTVDAEIWPCATHGTGRFEGALTPDGGSLLATFVTDYSACGQPYFWDGVITATVVAVP
jgi:hypothetical protein